MTLNTKKVISSDWEGKWQPQYGQSQRANSKINADANIPAQFLTVLFSQLCVHCSLTVTSVQSEYRHGKRRGHADIEIFENCGNF